MDVALGLKARTGKAVLVAVGGSAREPVYVERSELRLLPEGAFAPYHAAEKLDRMAARRSVALSIAAAQRLAVDGIRAAVGRLSAEGHAVRHCGVLVGNGMPDWSVDDIIAVHVRMHKAEGELFRNVVFEGARACGLAVTALPADSVLDAAAQELAETPARFATRLVALGKAAGAPWGKDQKEAAAAALAALASAGR